MNIIFFLLVAVAFVVAAVRHVAFTGDGTGPMDVLGQGIIKSAGVSVDVAIGLIGTLALFLGLMKIAEAGGLLAILARLMRPLMHRLFPDVPPDHPAMGAMILNMSANVLGLGNAATPFGIRAMQELDKLNPLKGTATNAMVLFLVINTANVTVLPTSVMALRAAVGSTDPAAVIPTTLFATFFSTVIAIIVCKVMQRLTTAKAEPVLVEQVAPAAQPAGIAMAAPRKPKLLEPDADELAEATRAYPVWVSILALALLASLVPLMIVAGRTISPWVIPGLIVAMLAFGMARGVRVYEVFVEGAKEGFEVAIKIIPYLVAILVAVGMFRDSGAMEMVIRPIGEVTALFGVPAEALTMAFMRSLSGSGSYGLLTAMMKDPAIGPDSYLGVLTGTIYASSETTFYVLAVYFGAVQIRRVRHALAAGIIADVAGVIGAVLICSWMFF